MKEYYLVDKSQIEALGVRNQKQFEKLTCGVVKGTIARKRAIGFNGEERVEFTVSDKRIKNFK